jgi:hypothetical protein
MLLYEVHLAAKEGHKSILKLLLSKVSGDYYGYPHVDPDKKHYVSSAPTDKGSRRTYESPELKYEIGVVCTLPSIAGIIRLSNSC